VGEILLYREGIIITYKQSRQAIKAAKLTNAAKLEVNAAWRTGETLKNKIKPAYQVERGEPVAIDPVEPQVRVLFQDRLGLLELLVLHGIAKSLKKFKINFTSMGVNIS
jgi:hypothetical protein